MGKPDTVASMRFFFTLLIILGAFMLDRPASARGEIKKRVHGDGSVEYYNQATRARPLPPTIYDDLIATSAARANVDPFLVKCLIKVESDFVADAVSVAGAMGLMQLMQETARYYGVRDPLDPEENLRAGTAHLRALLDYFNQDAPLALAAYHAGLGRVKKKMSIPPIKSTIEYVNRVMKLYAGGDDYADRVKILYKRIEKDGTIHIYSR